MVEVTEEDRAWQELVEYDDRTSPEEYPEMALITSDELADFMGRATQAERERHTASSELWTCFHCGESFTDRRRAASYFGTNEDAEPACRIDINAKSLIDRLRQAETDCDEMRQLMANEATDAARAYYTQTTRHNAQLRDVEQAGYDKGLKDGRERHAAALRIAREALEACLRHEFMDRCPAIQGLVRDEVNAALAKIEDIFRDATPPKADILCTHCGRRQSNALASRSTHCVPPHIVQEHLFDGKHPHHIAYPSHTTGDRT